MQVITTRIATIILTPLTILTSLTFPQALSSVGELANEGGRGGVEDADAADLAYFSIYAGEYCSFVLACASYHLLFASLSNAFDEDFEFAADIGTVRCR